MRKATKEWKRRRIIAIAATLGTRRQEIATPRYPDGVADEGCPAISAGEFYPSGYCTGSDLHGEEDGEIVSCITIVFPHGMESLLA